MRGDCAGFAALGRFVAVGQGGVWRLQSGVKIANWVSCLWSIRSCCIMVPLLVGCLVSCSLDCPQYSERENAKYLTRILDFLRGLSASVFPVEGYVVGVASDG